MLDFGDVPGWVGAVGTTGALLVSLVLLWQEQRRSDNLRSDQQRDQAKRITAWLEYNLPAGRFEPGATLWAKVRNGSDEPIYDVHAGHLGRQPPGMHPQFFWVGVVAPQQTLQMQVGEEFEPIGTQAWGLDLRFSDASGRHWLREESGRLNPRTFDLD